MLLLRGCYSSAFDLLALDKRFETVAMGDPMVVDKSKIKTRDPAMGEKWRMMSNWARFRFVTSIFRLLFVKILPKAIFGVCFGSAKSGGLQNVLPNCVWQAKGEHNGIEGFMTVVRLSEECIVLYNVVLPDESLVEEVRELGAKKVCIVVPSSSHDSFAVFWKEAFPGASVLCPRSSREKVAEVVEVDGTIEDCWAKLEPGWKLGFVDNGEAMNVDGELWYTLESPDDFRILLGDCGVMTSPNFRLSDALAGLARWVSGPSARMNAAWSSRVLTNPGAYRKALREIAEGGSFVVWASQHGRALTRNIKEALLAASESV